MAVLAFGSLASVFAVEVLVVVVAATGFMTVTKRRAGHPVQFS